MAKENQIRATKIIFRAGETLSLASLGPIAATQGLGLAAGLTQNQIANTTMLAEGHKNIIQIATHSEASRLNIIKIPLIEIGGQCFPCSGLRHAVVLSITYPQTHRPERLILASRNRGTRMIGRTTSDILIVKVSYLPTTINYSVTEIRCFPHPPPFGTAHSDATNAMILNTVWMCAPTTP